MRMFFSYFINFLIENYSKLMFVVLYILHINYFPLSILIIYDTLTILRNRKTITINHILSHLRLCVL